MQRMRRELGQSLGRDATDEEIAKELDLTVERLHELVDHGLRAEWWMQAHTCR